MSPSQIMGVVVMLNCAPSAEVIFAKLQVVNQPASATLTQGASRQLRNYGLGAAILRDLGVGKMKILAQPRKMPSMMGFGLEVTGYRGGDNNE